MPSILDFLNTANGNELVYKISENTSENKVKVTAALGLVFPILLGAIKNNLSSAEGKNHLNDTLSENTYNEGLINNIKNQDPAEIKEEGEKILDKYLGFNQEATYKVIGSILQISESSVSVIFKMAAPVLLRILSAQKSKEDIEASDLETLVDSVLGSSSKFDPSLIQTILTKSSEPNIIDDVQGMALGGNKSEKKDGGILGGMLGGK